MRFEFLEGETDFYSLVVQLVMNTVKQSGESTTNTTKQPYYNYTLMKKRTG